MSAIGPSLPVHSLTEARLYLQVTPCPACAAGPLIADPRGIIDDPDHFGLTVPTTCKTCGQSREIRFDTRQVGAPESASPPAGEVFAATDSNDAPSPTVPDPINPTDEPSRVIDVVGWLTLHSIKVDAAQAAETGDTGNPAGRVATRRMRIEAAQCLGEALKFFDVDNDLPPEDAFFFDASRRRFRESPEHFTRQHLIDLRRRLPC